MPVNTRCSSRVRLIQSPGEHVSVTQTNPRVHWTCQYRSFIHFQSLAKHLPKIQCHASQNKWNKNLPPDGSYIFLRRQPINKHKYAKLGAKRTVKKCKMTEGTEKCLDLF